MKKVSDEVKALNLRVNSLMIVTKMTCAVQIEQLAKAEKLRKAVRAVLKSMWRHRCNDRVGGCDAVSESKMRDLRNAMRGVTKFHVPAKMPAALRAMFKIKCGGKQ